MRSFALQLFVVALIVSALTYLTGWFNYRSGFNALWIFGVPIVVAIIANKDIGLRALVGLTLILWSWLIVSTVGVLLVGY